MRSVVPTDRKPFATLEEFAAAIEDPPLPDERARNQALERNGLLTKPEGALGRLEDLAIWYASWRGHPAPALKSPQIVVFAANHGVAERGVSAYPSEVTAQMVANFASGGAAINQLARVESAKLNVRAIGLDAPTQDIAEGPAMSEAEAVEAPAALFLSLGAGTGVSDAKLEFKSRTVALAVEANEFSRSDPLEVLRCLGGREIAAMVGAIARARVLGMPVILDGFVCTAAASILHSIDASMLDHAVAGHLSAESPHGKLLRKIGKVPLLDLGMRLGEASGAALAIGLLRCAVELHRGMSTFAEAGVSSGN